MKTLSPRLLPLLSLLVACRAATPDDGDDGMGSETTAPDPASSSTSGDGDGDGDGGDGDGDTSGDGDGDTSGDGDGDGDTSGDGDGDTSGDGDGDGDTSGDGDGDGDDGLPSCPGELTDNVGFCYLSYDIDEPDFTITQFDELFEDGDILRLQCGYQGSFMFEFGLVYGGFEPDEPFVPFRATLDVEEFNLGPSGYLAQYDSCVLAECCIADDDCNYDYGDLLRMFPADAIEDVSVLHGQQGILTITMYTPEEAIEHSWNVELWTLEGDNWGMCAGYDCVDGGPSEQLSVSLPIPIP